jgi:hypothetical protein
LTRTLFFREQHLADRVLPGHIADAAQGRENNIAPAHAKLVFPEAFQAAFVWNIRIGCRRTAADSFDFSFCEANGQPADRAETD